MYMSSIKCSIRRFHFVAVQWTSKKPSVLKSVMHVQSCCFAHKTNFFFCIAFVVVVIVAQGP